MDEQLKQMAAVWKKDLRENVLPFWLSNSLDEECGGYFTVFDRDGTLLSDSKYHWLQGREVWTFSRMHNCAKDATPAERESWYNAALTGVKFLDKAIRPSDGMLYFATTRTGEPLHYQRKPYTAVFYILGNLEFYETIRIRKRDGLACSEDPEPYKQKAVNMFEKFRLWINDPTLCGREKPPSDAKPVSVLGEVMCLASMSEEFIAKLPSEKDKYMPDVEDAMRRVKLHFDSKRKILMETADPVHGVSHETMEGRFFNPGHSIEVAWFLLHLCKLKPSEEHQNLALDVLEGSLRLGWDSVHGGVTYMMDVLGMPILDTTVTATNKLWWPQTEALYACTLAYVTTEDKKWMDWLQTIHDYCYKYFYDGKDKPGGGGEWFGYLTPDNKVYNRCKGGNYKGCFHVPRGLLYSHQVADTYLASKH